MANDQPGSVTARPAADGSVPDDTTGSGGWQAESAARAVSQASRENFPVALRVLPRRYRQHLLAVYAYARTVDDAGDLAPPGERAKLLGDLAEDVRRLYGPPGRAGPVSPAVRGLAGAVADCAIPMQPFLELIRANEQDQIVTRYETFEDLEGYCRLSANPVGHIVLYIFGSYTADRARLSDSVCTGLQLAEHWQDVAEDARAGRIYLPGQDMRVFGVTADDLLLAQSPPRLRQLIAFEVRRAGDLLSAGAPLIGGLSPLPRAAVAGYVAGGRAALAAISRAGYDVLAATPRPGKARTAAELIRAFAAAR
jgi:squalene synthase HpnC